MSKNNNNTFSPNLGLNMFKNNKNNKNNKKGNDIFGDLFNNINNITNDTSKISKVMNLSNSISDYVDLSFSIWWFIIYILIFVIFMF